MFTVHQNPKVMTKFQTSNPTWYLATLFHLFHTLLTARLMPAFPLLTGHCILATHDWYGGIWPTMSESDKETCLIDLNLEVTILKSWNFTQQIGLNLTHNKIICWDSSDLGQVADVHDGSKFNRAVCLQAWVIISQLCLIFQLKHGWLTWLFIWNLSDWFTSCVSWLIATLFRDVVRSPQLT